MTLILKCRSKVSTHYIPFHYIPYHTPFDIGLIITISTEGDLHHFAAELCSRKCTQQPCSARMHPIRFAHYISRSIFAERLHLPTYTWFLREQRNRIVATACCRNPASSSLVITYLLRNTRLWAVTKAAVYYV